MRCPHCSGMTPALVLLADVPDVPNSPTRKATLRIAKRQEPKVAEIFLKSIENLKEQINEVNLGAAIATGAGKTAEAVRTVPVVGSLAAEESALYDVIFETQTLTGTAASEIVSEASGIDVAFNAKDPNAVIHARTQTAKLVVEVSETTKEAIRVAIAAGQEIGLTPVQIAKYVREVVGLPPNWINAPSALERNLWDAVDEALSKAERNAAARNAVNRRLSAVDKARIKNRIRLGTVDQAFVDEMREKYGKSLLNRRALNIAQTETARAANFGQHEAWRQAQAEGVLPSTARRIVIITPDDRLRETHAQVAISNSEGVPINQPFDTPWGALMDPPWEPLCLLPDTEMQGRFFGGLKAEYSGEVVVIQTARGRKLTVTPNHPILTSRGFVAANLLTKGDELLGYRDDLHRASLPKPNEDQSPAKIEDIYRSLCESLPVGGCDPHVDDLHGDARGTKGNVEIVGAYRELLVAGQTESPDLRSDAILKMPKAAPAEINALGVIGPPLDGMATSAVELMGGGDLCACRGGVAYLHDAPLFGLSFGLGAELHANTLKAVLDGCPITTEALAEFVDRLPVGIAGYHLVHREPRNPFVVVGTSADLFAGGEPELDSPVTDCGGTDAQLFRDLLKGESGGIEVDEVVSVDRGSWHGHVYDLQSVVGWNIANGLIVSNCRCGTALIFPGLVGVL